MSQREQVANYPQHRVAAVVCQAAAVVPGATPMVCHMRYYCTLLSTQCTRVKIYNNRHTSTVIFWVSGIPSIYIATRQ
eukprot:2203263-Rhodomonas_salina.2